MVIVWVTGTNGKTTASNIIAEWLRASGKKVFMFTTVNIILGDETFTNESKMTSPDVFELQKWLSIARKRGCEVAVIETASHGIKMHRVWGLNYDVSVLTNITQDHLDLHRTMEDYVDTKLTIFRKLMLYERKPGVKKTGVINIESDYADIFLEQTYDNLYTYWFTRGASISTSDVKNKRDGMEFTVKIPWDTLEISTTLRWKFNVANILASIGVLISLWVEKKIIECAIQKVPGVPGRMEELKSSDGFFVFIDYAHTPDALENVLTTLEGIRSKWRIITVFGACGERDTSNRPSMWSVVSKYSDMVILTQDDDYGEKPEDIIKDVIPGVNRKEGEDFWVILDRTEAIRTALVMAKRWDIILIAGKGDEHVRITNDGPIQWHDKTLVLKVLSDIEENAIMK